jgi:hypothetical protein
VRPTTDKSDSQFHFCPAGIVRSLAQRHHTAFVVHGTMAGPRWLDPAVDPNKRTPGTDYLGDPAVVSKSPVGLARFCTLRSWLSQWSCDDANGDGIACGRDAVSVATDRPVRHDLASTQ